jgi:hypothetical protein
LNRKLLILDVALMAAVIYTGVRTRDQIRAAKAREAAVLSRKAAPAAPPPLVPLPPVPPALPSTYASIAQNMLFDKSRNSTVVVETPAAPPPKPVPPLPFYHGQMRLPGEGQIVILSLASNKEHEAVHPGEVIGPFKLVSATSQELSFEWEGQVIRKSLDELIDRGGSGSPAPAAASPRASAPPPAVKSAVGPGTDAGNGTKACLPNDSYEDGAVVDGYRKSQKISPFGTQCQWDQVK